MQQHYGDIEKHLVRNETIQWEGFPNPSILFNVWDCIYIPIGLLCLFPLLLELWLGDIDLGGFIFLLPIIYFAFGRFIVKYFNKKNTRYYITNKRIIIFNENAGAIKNELDINNISKLKKRVSRNGIGSIEFGNIPFSQATGGNSGMDFVAHMKIQKIFGRDPLLHGQAYEWIPVFYDIDDVDSVFELVNQIRNKAANIENRQGRQGDDYSNK